MKKITNKVYKQLLLQFLKDNDAYSRFEYYYLKQKEKNKNPNENLLDTVITNFGAYYLIEMLTPISRTPYSNPNEWDKLSEKWMNFISVYEVSQALTVNHNVKGFTVKHKYASIFNLIPS